MSDIFFKLYHDEWAKIQGLYSDRKIDGCEVMLLFSIMKWGWEKPGKGRERNYCQKKATDIGKEIGRSPSAIRRAIKRLEDVGLLCQHFQTRKKGEPAKFTKSVEVAMKRTRNGAKQLPSYFELTF